jgi:hypothetical protein
MKLEGHFMTNPVLDDFTCPVTIVNYIGEGYRVSIDTKATYNDQHDLNHFTLLGIHSGFLVLLWTSHPSV